MTITTERPTDHGGPTLDMLRAGDVLRWTPETRHCYEGQAVVKERADGSLYVVDTYWHHNRTALTAAQLATATVEWNLHDFTEVNRLSSQWNDMAAADRRVLSSQHGLSRTFYVRIGAAPDRSVILANAEARVAAAEAEVRSAQRLLDLARADLARLTGGDEQ